MATTEKDGEVDAIPPQSELDKLGPLGSKGSILSADGELRVALIEELVASSEAAREAARSAGDNAIKAVHEYRKGLRRARAILSLVSAALPKNERRAVRRAFQEARRSVSAVRDHAVAPDTLVELPLAEDDRQTADMVIAQAAAAMPPALEVQQRLVEGAARATAQVEALEAALPQVLELATLIDGVREVYAEARRARRDARRDTAAFHTWRRRTKELVYQLELLAGWAGPHTQKLHHIYEKVTDALSNAVDLIMLRDFIETYGHGIPATHLGPLTHTIQTRLDKAMIEAKRASKRAFRRPARKLAKRLARAIAADVEPLPAT